MVYITLSITLLIGFGLCYGLTSLKEPNTIISKKNNSWLWNNTRVNYICKIRDHDHKCDEKVAVLLIHGFGSSSYHWRHNIDEISKHHDVYAIDLIGFGKSEKPTTVNYDIKLWTQQAQDFIDEIIKKDTVIIGNSLGGCIAINASQHNLVKRIILLNAFVILDDTNNIFTISKSFIRLCVNWLLPHYLNSIQTDDTIYNSLKDAYPVNPCQIDDKLINSIKEPLTEKNINKILTNMTDNFFIKQSSMQDIMNNNKKPWYLLWGKKDSWIHDSMAQTILKSNSHTVLEYVDAGHCPHDEIPSIVNSKIISFLSSL